MAGARYPVSHEGRPIPPCEGRSLLPVFQGKGRKGHEALFWNQAGRWRAVRMGKWKLVSPDHTIQYNPWRADRKGRLIQPAADDPNTSWELYDMRADRTKRHNVAGQFPSRVRRMAAAYSEWERRTAATMPE